MSLREFFRCIETRLRALLSFRRSFKASSVAKCSPTIVTALPCGGCRNKPTGFMSLAGEGDEAFDAGLVQVFATNDVLKPSYLLWYSPPLSWQARLDVIPDLVRVRARARFRFSAERAAWLREATRYPPGYELRRVSAHLAPEAEGFGLDIASHGSGHPLRITRQTAWASVSSKTRRWSAFATPPPSWTVSPR